jgi:Flp pilus assembly protein TadB
MSLDVYAAAELGVANLSDDECDALMAALERRVDRWELEHRGASFTPQTLDLRRTSQVSLQRRRPGWRDQWRVWRVCFLVIGIIVMVAVSAGLVFGNVAVVVVLLAVFAACAAASHRITGGKASVCH